MKKEKSISDVRNDMIEDMNNARTGKLDGKIAGVLTNMFGKVISSSLAQIVYAKARKETPNVKFLSEAK